MSNSTSTTTCRICRQTIHKAEIKELRAELAAQADAYGMECLTEHEQMVLHDSICLECYKDNR